MKKNKLLQFGLILLLIIIALVLSLGSIDLRLYVAYAAGLIAILSALAFSVLNLFTNFRKNAKVLGIILFAVGLFIIYYFITPRTDIDPMILEKTGTSLSWSPIIGAGLYFLYTLLGFFILIIIGFSIRNLTK
ncbi:MAG: hypothetical protein N2Z72_00315 [Bacteroidales bacterium]|nr:hypothetical protein [Bacteroidales bacterium]